MTTTLAILTCMTVSITPLKTALLMVLISLVVSLMILISKSNSFTAAALVISFSSGMMIMYCYCAMMTSFEKKKSNFKLTVMALMPMIMVSQEDMMEMTNSAEISVPMKSDYLLISMTIVVISMISVNKSMFHPLKTSMTSY